MLQAIWSKSCRSFKRTYIDVLSRDARPLIAPGLLLTVQHVIREKIKGGDASERPERFEQAFDLGRRHALAASQVFAHDRPDAQVVRRKGIRAGQPPDEKIFRGPWAPAPDLEKDPPHLVVGQFLKSLQVQLPAERPSGEIANVFRFSPG